MDKATKQDIIKKYATSENDTGSSEVQIAVLSQRIKELTEHLRNNKKDNSTRHGLLTLVGRRRKLLRYLNRENHSRYMSITEELGIRRNLQFPRISIELKYQRPENIFSGLFLSKKR